MSPGDQLIQTFFASFGDIFTTFVATMLGGFITAIIVPLLQQLSAALGLTPAA